MPTVVVPLHYPLNKYSLTTLREAVRIAHAEGAELTVLHVDQFHDKSRVSRRQLEQACKRHVSSLETVNYSVRRGRLIEETILEEIDLAAADIVVIGRGQAGRWRRLARRLLNEPDIQVFLQEELDCAVVTVPAD